MFRKLFTLGFSNWELFRRQVEVILDWNGPFDVMPCKIQTLSEPRNALAA
jgi:hypothetical protein